MIFLLCFIGVISGIALCVYSIRTPIVIKFSYSWSTWAEPIFIGFSLLLLAFVLEYIFSSAIIQISDEQTLIGFWLHVLFENGLLIPFLCAGLSFIFEKMIERLNIDYFEYYSDFIAKVCFTVLDVASCISMLIMAQKANVPLGRDYYFFACRVVMWFLTAVGIWIGFGFGCKGRIEQENNKRNRLLVKRSKNEWVKFAIPVAWPLLVCLILLAIICCFDVQEVIRYENFFFVFLLVFVVTGFVTMFICKRIYNPNEQRSTDDFYILVEKYRNGKSISKRFGRNKYHIEGDMLIIEKINIHYPGHEQEEKFVELFNEKSINIDYGNLDSMLNFLKKRRDEQSNYIMAGYKNCVEEQKRKRLTPI